MRKPAEERFYKVQSPTGLSPLQAAAIQTLNRHVEEVAAKAGVTALKVEKIIPSEESRTGFIVGAPDRPRVTAGNFPELIRGIADSMQLSPNAALNTLDLTPKG